MFLAEPHNGAENGGGGNRTRDGFRDKRRCQYVYFVQEGDSGPVKVGIAAEPPTKEPSDARATRRIAYADPPYPGCAHLYKDHPDYAGEVDHAEAKPDAVCRWLFEVLGCEPADQLHDMFPGTGAVTAAWNAWRSQLSLLAGGEAA